MDDLNIDEIKQLVNFYKQRSSDLELQVLQLQLRINKLNLQARQSEEPIPATKLPKK